MKLYFIKIRVFGPSLKCYRRGGGGGSVAADGTGFQLMEQMETAMVCQTVSSPVHGAVGSASFRYNTLVLGFFSSLAVR